MGASPHTKKIPAIPRMDILQQSLQAADILSGDDLFGELGLNLDNVSSESVELPNELEALVSQTQPYGGLASQNTDRSYFGATSGSDMSGSVQFDTSQFLNTSASVNASVVSLSSGIDRQSQMYVQRNDTNAANQSNVHNLFQSAYSTPSSVQYVYQQQSGASTMYAQGGTSQAMQSSYQNVASSLIPSQTCLVSTVSVTQAYSVATCNSVFSRAPTQAVLSTPQMNSNHASGGQSALPAGIQVVNQQAFQALPCSAAEKLQTSNTGQNVTVLGTANVQIVPNSTGNTHNARQLLVMQNQTSSLSGQNIPANQLVNGMQANPLNQNRNIAVLQVAGGKQNVNLSDPQVVKALTASLVQKQQTDVQTQQYIKLGQNSSYLNVAASRPQQQQAAVQKTQQIMLQNGQTILLNNGQQVQLCNPPSQNQRHVLEQSVHQNTSNSNQLATNQQATRNGQLPIKGIQIASVNIPIASSASSTFNVSPAQSNILTIPVLTKQEASRSTSSPTSHPTVASQGGHVMQFQNSSTVRSLLANSILKQNKNSVAVTNTVSMSSMQRNPQSPVTTQVASVNGPVSGGTTAVQRAQLGATLRLNLTPQQASQLTTAQLQTILKQHQAAMQARAVANTEAKSGTPELQRQGNTASPASQKPQQQVPPSPGSLAAILRPSTSNNLTPVGNAVVVNKTPTCEQPSMQVFRVDPTLTEEKADEVKKFLANRSVGAKMNSLTREQQQLVLAFQAQIKAMSPPVQQYYLRNPQLFMQKVMNQIRAGRPFILQVKTDSHHSKPKIMATTVTPIKPQHPTISLTQDPPRLKRISTPPPTASIRVPVQTVRAASPAVVKPIVIPTPTATVTVQVPRKAIKRPAPEPTQNVSLVLEQLECHKRMVTAPDCAHPFKSVRDAIRRLVPFHAYNVPSIKENDFVQSEKLFDRISDRIMARTRAMVNKYHLLCLRDSTRDSCSAEMVMIERMFLQKEKAKLAEDKARIKANPSVIKEYFPNTAKEPASITVEIADDDPRSRSSSVDSSYQAILTETRSGNETDISSYIDSPAPNSHTSAYSRTGASSHRTSLEGRSYSHDSFAGPDDFKQPGAVGTGSHGSHETLLQEAVDSILL